MGNNQIQIVSLVGRTITASKNTTLEKEKFEKLKVGNIGFEIRVLNIFYKHGINTGKDLFFIEANLPGYAEHPEEVDTAPAELGFDSLPAIY